MRPGVMKDNSGATVAQIGKMLGKMWKNVSEDDRAPFEKKAAAAKASYTTKREKYEKSAGYKRHQMKMLAWKIHETKKPFKKDENAPKRALSAYMLYAASVRSKILKENPDMEVTEVMKEQSVWWKALSEKDREPWVNKAAAEKKKYQAKLERYMKTADYTSYVTARDEYKKEMLEKRNKLMGIKKRARSVSKSASAPKKQKRASKSRSRPVSRKRSVSRRRAKSPRSPKRVSRKRRAVKRRSRTPKASRRRAAKRRSRTPKASKKRSSSRRASTPKAPKREAKSKSATPKRRAAKRRSRTPKSSRKSSARKSRTPIASKSRSVSRRARTPKAPKQTEDGESVKSATPKKKRSKRRSRTPKSSRRR